MNSPGGFPVPNASACSAAPTNRRRSASLEPTRPRATAWACSRSSRPVSFRSSTRTSFSVGAGSGPPPCPGGDHGGSSGDGSRLSLPPGKAGPPERQAGSGSASSCSSSLDLNPSGSAGGGFLGFIPPEGFRVRIRGWQSAAARGGRGWQSRTLAGGGRAPGEVDAVGAPPAIHGPLVVGLGDDPSEVDELAPGVLDASEVDVEGACDPGGLDPAAGLEPPPAPRQASEQDGDGGGDECGSCAVGQESEDATRDGEGAVARRRWCRPGSRRPGVARVGEPDVVVGPGEEPGGDESFDGGAGPPGGDAGEP